MITSRDILQSLIIAMLFALPTTIFFSFAPSYSETVLVPTMPMEQFYKLREKEQRLFLESEGGLKQVAGMEKVLFLLKATPETYLLKFSILLLPFFLACFISFYIAGKRHEI